MLKYFNTLLLIMFAVGAFAQNINGCDGMRYVKEIFDIEDIKKTTVKFGENTDAQGNFMELFMDIYTPEGDAIDARPVMVWVFGGAYIGGEKEDMKLFCETYAKLGYVTATIDYRLWDLIGGFPDSTNAMNIAVMSMGDLKAAVRHFRQSHDEGNTYGIDPDKIFVGGLSAGSITAMHSAVIDEDDELVAFFEDLIELNGGLEGNSGDEDNMQYSSEVKAVVNYSGAVYDTSWIDQDDPPILSFHGTADNTVKFGYGYASVFSFDIIQLHGSQNIQQRQENLGKETILFAVEGANHYNAYTDNQFQDERDDFTKASTLFLYELICEGIPLSVDEHLSLLEAGIHPNPASHELNIRFEKNYERLQIQIIDMQGKIIYSDHLANQSKHQIPVEYLTSGLYTMRIMDLTHEALPVSMKFLVQH